jgi:hypothetical protein
LDRADCFKRRGCYQIIACALCADIEVSDVVVCDVCDCLTHTTKTEMSSGIQGGYSCSDEASARPEHHISKHILILPTMYCYPVLSTNTSLYKSWPPTPTFHFCADLLCSKFATTLGLCAQRWFGFG